MSAAGDFFQTTSANVNKAIQSRALVSDDHLYRKPSQDVRSPIAQQKPLNLSPRANFERSPESTWSSGRHNSAEAASLRWFGLLTQDAVNGETIVSPKGHSEFTHDLGQPYAQHPTAIRAATDPINATSAVGYVSRDEVRLEEVEVAMFKHFVKHLSTWIDVTDPGASFSVVVPRMALRNHGLMSAVLALSSRHLSLNPSHAAAAGLQQLDRTLAVQYYHGVLQYLQQEMEKTSYLVSDELLATVLTISTYEMIDGSAKGCERHLVGVFWIQRSQLIHGESEGLKRCIWWAWLRQDIWAAFKERRKILSFYTLSRPCSSLGFWELVNRAVFLLGQCVNYASIAEVEAGKLNIQARMERADSLQACLEEWCDYFAPHNQPLPTKNSEVSMKFKRIWIHPPAAAFATQVHHFSRLLLLENRPAFGGLRDLAGREVAVKESIDTICGVAQCVDEEAMVLASLQAVYAAGLHERDEDRRQEILQLLHKHQEIVKWPSYDITADLCKEWQL
ncbi:L-arabinose-responsive transcription regulator ARA1-like [Teratosphaeria destructans]|uniref:L-arabinose-responsive transcription regulator ARA1-like n=1 Tax=Teratosphaeria destructans TaxID=418781 RepID=A0A9W7W754_9PEZI|nr:L-arabinose-responsive transcription regulator ARA1-like [Teratosphaeria destructans]